MEEQQAAVHVNIACRNPSHRVEQGFNKVSMGKANSQIMGLYVAVQRHREV